MTPICAACEAPAATHRRVLQNHSATYSWEEFYLCHSCVQDWDRAVEAGRLVNGSDVGDAFEGFRAFQDKLPRLEDIEKEIAAK